MMLTENTYLKIVRTSAYYDLIATICFATPWTFIFLLQSLRSFDAQFNIPGIIPEPDVLHILFANLLGSVVIIWSIVRLKLNLVILGRADAVTRFLFASWQIYALLSGASWIIYFFLFFEILFFIAQSLPIKLKSSQI